MNWLQYFQSNRDHRRSIPWEEPIDLNPSAVRPLIRSLQRFQVGESGEGLHLKKAAATTQDAEYCACIDLFIKEEQEHARLMAEFLKRLNAPLILSHWTNFAFIQLRRLLGLKHELLVLLMPEMIAKRYFRALHDGSRDPILRAMTSQILHDEEGHVAFHIDFLQRAFANESLLRRVLIRVVWRILYRATCAVVWVDHRRAFRACGVGALAFWWDCGLIFDEVAAGIFNTAPVPVMLRTAGPVPE